MSGILARALLRPGRGPVRRAIERWKRDPVGTQAELLRGLLRRAAGTEWGRRYGFADLAREPDVVAAYQARVPLHGWDEFHEPIARMLRGESDILWPGRIRDFTDSGGTISTGRLLPSSPEMFRYRRRAQLDVAVSYAAAARDLSFLRGKHLTLAGTVRRPAEYPGIRLGGVSAMSALHAPWWFRRLFYAVPNEIGLMEGWDRKLTLLAEHAVDKDVRVVVAMPSFAPVLFERVLETYNRRTGAGAKTVGEVWPNLRVFMSGGVALSSYRALLEALIGLPRVHFVESYGATEGFFAFQDDLDDPAMLLHVNSGVFYEFVRMDELGRPDARRHTVADVEPGVRYALYVTTCSGLWSFAVRDVVQFTRLFPHKLRVAGRTTEMLDRFGESVFSDEVRAALEHACQATGARALDYHVTVRPVEPGRMGGHQWLIEFEREPDDVAAFAAAIDARIAELNRHYDITRSAHAMEPPEIVALPRGTFTRWLKETRGTVHAQMKVPRVSEDRRLADGVLALAAAEA